MKYYVKSKNMAALVECDYNLEDFDGLKQIVEDLPEGDSLHFRVADYLMSVGLNDEAVTAFLKGGDVKKAIDCCVLLNQWSKVSASIEQS